MLAPLVCSLRLPRTTGPADTLAVKTQAVQVDGHPKDSEEPRVGMAAQKAEGPGVGAEGAASAKGSFAGGLGDPAALAEAAPMELRVATSSTVTAIPDERAVWVSQRLRIRSTQNLVDPDLEADATPCVSGGGGDDGATVPDGGSPHRTQPPKNEQNEAATRQRHGTRQRARDASSLAATTAVARYGPRMGRNNHIPLSIQRTGKKTAPGSRRTRRKVRVKAFDIRVEEYKEERRHVSGEGFS